ncbi:MAG: hypothetical protein K8U57_11500 [Planctomycetes bacterium]|nr:hypothetical protein [Planctomycetota bacterium]
MALEFNCSACEARIRVPDEMAGRLVQCGHCRAAVKASTVEPLEAIPVLPVPEPPPIPAYSPRRRSPDSDATPPRDDRDSFDELPKRTRRPRRPRPAPRREAAPRMSATTAMLMIFGIVGFSLLVIGGFIAWRLIPPSTKWQSFDSVRGGFKVEFPAPSKTNVGNRFGVSARSGSTTEGTSHRGIEYTVAWSNIPGGRNAWVTEDQLFTTAMDEVRRAAPSSEFATREPFKVSGFPARDMVITSVGDGVYVARVVVADSRIFVLVAGGPSATAEHADVRRFLDSFTITDVGLLNSEKQRLANAERDRIATEQARAAEAKRIEAERQRFEEQRIAAERVRELAEKNRLHSQMIAEQNESFLKPPRDGPTSPQLEDFAHGLDEVVAYNFEETKVDGVWASDATGFGTNASGYIRSARLGVGARGNAAYLVPSSTGASYGVLEEDRPPIRRTFENPQGFTLGGWVRTRYRGVEVFRVGTGDTPLVQLTVGRSTVSARVAGKQESAELTHPWTADDEWHHVALVVERKPTGAVVRLYFDGKLVTVGAASGMPAPTWMVIGGITSKAGEGTNPPDFDGQPAPLAKETLVAAVDECCMIARPLVYDEVRSLAGRAPPPSPLAVKLTPGKHLGSLSSVAFDPARKIVWVVTSNDPFRFPPLVDGQTPTAPAASPAKLRKLSYPGLEQLASYDLPGPVTATAFDQPRNRLFMAVTVPKGEHLASSQGWPAGLGTIQRFDLDTMPANGKLLLPDAESEEKFAVRAMVVSPNGATVYFTANDAKTMRGRLPGLADVPDGRLYRVTDSLCWSPVPLPGNEQISCPNRIELSADGKTLSLFRPVTKGAAGAELLDVDTEKWQIREGIMAHIYAGDWASMNERRYFVSTGSNDQSMDVHSLPTIKNISSLWGIGATGRQYLGTLARGRLLVTSGADPLHMKHDPQNLNSLRIYESTGKNMARSKPWKPLAELKESTDVLVGGPFWISPDGKTIVFRSGQVVNVESISDIAPRPVPATPAPPVVIRPHTPIAPRPREKFLEADVVAATQIPGLKFYLPCDKITDNTITDAVSGKVVGQLGTAELIHGPRGQALRLTSVRVNPKQEPIPGITILDPRVMRVPADKPFTISLWARGSAEFPGDGASWVASGMSWTADDEIKRTLWLSNQVKVPIMSLREQLDSSNSNSDVKNSGTVPVDAPTKWNHYTLSRNEQNEVIWCVNGTVVKQRGKYELPLDYDSFRFVVTHTFEYVVDLDEVCVFDRALTSNEIRSLAGRHPLAAGQTLEIVAADPGDIAPRPKSTPKNPGDMGTKTPAIAIAPAPRISSQPYRGGPVPAASDIKGLTFYLACDEIGNDNVKDAVSGKFVGTLHTGILVDGVRGKALRLDHVATSKLPAALDISDQAKAFAFGEGKPFTLSFWTRRIVSGAETQHLLVWGLGDTTKYPFSALVIGAEPGMFYGSLAEAEKPKSIGETVARAHGKHDRWADWTHVVMIRDEKNVVQFVVNGEAMRTKTPISFPKPLNFKELFLVASEGEKVTFDLDEFCLFDRALTNDEVQTLAGTKNKPKLSDPDDMGVKGVSRAPLPRLALAPYKGGPVPAPTDIKGLVWYLPLDGIENGKLTEAVSGKAVGELGTAELISGVRGRALRLTSEPGRGGEAPIPGITLQDPSPLRIPGRKPFTLSVWLRWEKINDAPTSWVFKGRTAKEDGLVQEFHLRKNNVIFFATFTESNFKKNQGQILSNHTTRILNATEWNHILITRDEETEIALYLNGVSLFKGKAFTGAVDYDVCTLASAGVTKCIVDVDEFCVFDRALTIDEIQSLAGTKAKAQPKDSDDIAPKLSRAPMPRVLPPRYSGGPVPAASDIKGLTFYLACDEIGKNNVKEMVSGKFVGTLKSGELIDGVRGKALRLTHKRTKETIAALDLSDQTELFAVDEAKPFTIAFWARRSPTEPLFRTPPTLFSLISSPETTPYTSMWFGVDRQSLIGSVSQSPKGNAVNGRVYNYLKPKVDDWAEWNHIVVLRNEKNVIQLVVNGELVADPKPQVSSMAITCKNVLLMSTNIGESTYDFDEFCMFNRELTSDEIKSLAGRGEKK